MEEPQAPKRPDASASPSDATEEKKRKRPDRSKAAKAGKEHFVVKCALLGRLKGDASVREAMRREIVRRVKLYSRRVDLASLALMSLLKEHFDGVMDFGACEAPEYIFGQTFMRQLLIGTAAAKKPDPLIASLYSRHPELLQGNTEFLGSQNVWSFGAIRMLTCLENSLRTNLVRRMGNFARAYAQARNLGAPAAKLLRNALVWGPDSAVVVDFSERLREQTRKKAARSAVEASAGGQEDEDDDEELVAPDEVVLIMEVARAHRHILGFAPREGALAHELTSAYDLEDSKAERHMGRILVYFAFLLREREALGAPLFNLCPVFSLKLHHMTVDTSVLYGIAKDAGLLGEKTSGKAFAEFGAEHWASMLEVGKVVRRPGVKFTGTIDTDGISVSMHFERPRKGPEERAPKAKKAEKQDDKSVATIVKPKDLEDAVVVGIDPGRSNIFTAALELPDSRIVSLRLTRGRYRRESGQLRAERNTQRWQARIRASLDALTHVSSKGLSLDNHWAHVAQYLGVREAIWAEHSNACWARQRLRLYGGKHRAMDRFFNEMHRACHEVAPGERIVVAYGAAGFAATAKREASVPVKWAKQACAKRFQTCLTDEFRSTAVDYATGTLLKAVWSRVADQRIRGLLWCDPTIPGSAGKLVNRDVNAALNIRKCFLQESRTGTRPAQMCRIACKGSRLPKAAAVGRILLR